MEIFSNISMLLGGSWATGVNMYLTIAGLGLASKFNWIQLPGNLEVISSPVIIIIAGVLYLIDFITDKIPAIDSIMDSIYEMKTEAMNRGYKLDYLILGANVYHKFISEPIHLGLMPTECLGHKILISYEEKNIIAFVEIKTKRRMV